MQYKKVQPKYMGISLVLRSFQSKHIQSGNETNGGFGLHSDRLDGEEDNSLDCILLITSNTTTDVGLTCYVSGDTIAFLCPMHD